MQAGLNPLTGEEGSCMTDLLAFIKQRDRTIGIGGLPQGVSHPCSCSIPGPWGGGVIVALVGIASGQ
jgi:hypothetical protein